MKFLIRGASNLQLVSRSSIRRASHVALSAPNPVTTCGNLRHLRERASEQTLLGEQCSQWSDHFHLPPQLRLISAQRRRASNCEWCENSLTHRALYYHPSLPLPSSAPREKPCLRLELRLWLLVFPGQFTPLWPRSLIHHTLPVAPLD